jgi:hypothetical protein
MHHKPTTHQRPQHNPPSTTPVTTISTPYTQRETMDEDNPPGIQPTPPTSASSITTPAITYTYVPRCFIESARAYGSTAHRTSSQQSNYARAIRAARRNSGAHPHCHHHPCNETGPLSIIVPCLICNIARYCSTTCRDLDHHMNIQHQDTGYDLPPNYTTDNRVRPKP